MARYKSYIICTSPRSGSTLLCKLLAATGKAGKPGSYFHVPSLSNWASDYNLSADHFATERDLLGAIFDGARARGTDTTGMFGLRLQRHSFEFFMQQINILHPGLSSDPQRIQAAFGNTLFIHLSRANKLDQAISLVKANQTGLWHRAPDGTELERLSAPQDPVYDADEIARHLAELTALDEDWRTWFAKEKLAPLAVSYDELSADHTKILGRILEHLGLDQKIAQNISPPVAKLADATSQAWADRFRTEQ